MENIVTKEDLRQFGLSMMHSFKMMLEGVRPAGQIEGEWIKSREVRRILGISPKSVQNLRIGGMVRFKKVIGTYYYNRSDIEKLFHDGKQ